MKNTRICILLPNMEGGGAERVGVNLANELSTRGYKVDIVLLEAVGIFLGELTPSVRVINLNVKRMRWCLIPLIKYLIINKPDAILANMWPLTTFAILSKLLARSRTKVIAVEHTTWSRSEMLTSVFSTSVIKLSMKLSYKYAHRIVVVSIGAANDLASFAKIEINKICVIYNPITGNSYSTNHKLERPLESWSVGNHKKIIAVGTLKKIKDYETLIKAIAILRKEVNVKLVILGEGECRQNLETLVRSLQLEDAVFLPGFSSSLSSYFSIADLHVLSSTGEGFGNVIVEALSFGIPVVSTDCPSGPREILSDGIFGVLAPVSNAEKLAEAILQSLKAVHDPAVLVARSNEFSINQAVEKYLELINSP